MNRSALSFFIGVAVGSGAMFYTSTSQSVEASNQSLMDNHVASSNKNFQFHQVPFEQENETALILSESKLNVNQELASDLYSESDRQYQDDSNDDDLERLNEEARNSPDYKHLQALFGLNKDDVSFEDIGRAAPHLTYTQKLKVESLLQENPKVGMDFLIAQTKWPNTGDENKNGMYLALSTFDDNSSDYAFLIDSLVESECEHTLSAQELIGVIKIDAPYLKKAYLKKDLQAVKRFIVDNDVCSRF